MCYVSYQIDQHLADEDREDARNEWVGMMAEDDGYGRYMQDAAEALDGKLGEMDNAILEDSGLDAFEALSSKGKEAIADKALELAIEDGFSRYDE